MLTVVLVALFAAALAASPADARAEAWARPVAGEVVRRFDFDHSSPFTAGRSRVVRFAAARGAPVRAACGGVIAFAGPLPTGRWGVTIACGRWRVTHTGLKPRRRVGTAFTSAQSIAAGDRLGRAAGHHVALGVRRAGDPFGYVDPMTLLPAASPPAGPLPGPSRRHPPAPRTRVPPPAARLPVPPTAPRTVAGPRRHRAADSPALTARGDRLPWTFWVGVAGLLAAAAPVAALRRRASRPRRAAEAARVLVDTAR